MTDSPMPAPEDLQHRALVGLLLRSLGIAVLWAAGAITALAWVASWDGAPHFGVAAYLFLSMLVGAGVLLALAKRLGPTEAEQPQQPEGSVSQ
jgi:hypothetical protein